MSSRHRKASGTRHLLPPPPPLPRETDDEEDLIDPMLAFERALRHLRRIKGPIPLKTFEEASDAFESLTPGELQDSMSNLPSDRKALAQEIAFEALSSEDDEEALEMAEQALKMDEECADALHVVAEYSPTLPELVRGMERASRVARQQIESTLGQGPPDVWTMVDAGPYLRAERRIADALRSLGELEEANRHYETVLAVDTEDFGTARPLLLGSYLALNLLEESRGLLLQMEQQAEEDWALITWGRILERFLSGDVATAERLAKPAMRKNRYIQKTLTASRMPKNLMPGDAKPGSQGEALLCMYTVGIAWLSHEPAMDWLRGLQ